MQQKANKKKPVRTPRVMSRVGEQAPNYSLTASDLSELILKVLM